MLSTGEKPKIKAVGCLLECGGKFLILQRCPKKNQGGKWGLPAGRVEKGEDENDAIIREVQEEVGFLIPPEKLEFLKKLEVAYIDRIIDFFVYRVKLEERIEVVLESQEHQAYTWVTGKECYARDDLINGVRGVLEKTGYMFTDAV